MLVQTNRLYLRPVISSDLNDLFKIYGDPATNTFNPAGPYPNIDNAKMVMNRWLDHWQTHSFGNWAISPLTNPEKIIGFGGLGIRNYDDIVINNLGYRLSTEAWGKGLATEFAIYAINSPENHVLPFRFCHKDDALEGKTYWATLQYLLAACSSGK